jgi:hypothetical protein
MKLTIATTHAENFPLLIECIAEHVDVMYLEFFLGNC